MAINWDSIDEQYNNGDYKNWATPGIYTVKCDDVEFKKVGAKGNYVMKFHFEETPDTQFPTADHFLSKDKDNWRIHHTKNLFIVLGASEAQAKKGCEVAEGKDDYEAKVPIYEKGLKTLIAKKPEVEIEVFQDGKYTRAEFRSRLVAMPHGDADKRTADAIIEDSEEIILDTELPF